MKISVEENGHGQQAKLLKRCISERISAEYTEGGMVVELCVDSNIGGEESYRISACEGGWKITGTDERGLFYGIGKFLHTAGWCEEAFVPKPPKGVMEPACSFRGIYFAVHFYNWYHMASTQELERYLEEMLLWGYSSIFCIIPIINLDTFEDTLFFESVEKSISIFQLAKKLSMKVGILICPNQGLRTAPAELDADLSFVGEVKEGDAVRPTSGRNICPAKPGAVEYLRGIWNTMLDQYRDVGLDYVVSWPYDEGGCGCEICRPWGAKGYCDLVNLLHRDTVERYPDSKFVVSAWFYDVPEEGEHEGLYRRLESDMDYVDYIMAGAYGTFPDYPLEHEPVKPVLDFPEISMWGLGPWGGRGANPMPKRLQGFWDRTRHILSGGMPYSEGMYEDISKIQYVGYYWEPQKHYREILSEYISYYYAGDVCGEVLEMMELMEANHAAVAGGEDPDMELASRGAQLAQAVDAHLGVRAKQSWRWRILYIRARIDEMVYRRYLDTNPGVDEKRVELMKTREYLLADNEEAQELLQELCGYYHCIDKIPDNRYTFPPVRGGRVLRQERKN